MLPVPSKRTEQIQMSAIRRMMNEAGRLRALGHPVISWSVGEPDFNTPQAIKAATVQALESNYTHSSSNLGLLELRQAVAAKLEEELGLKYRPTGEILITNGAAEAISASILAVLDEGDEVIIPTPAFISYANCVHLAGGKVVEVPLSAEDNFQLDAERLAAAVTERTKLIIINNPNNPSGAVYAPQTLAQVANLAVEKNLWVLSDEIYRHFLYDNARFRSLASFPGMRERTLMVSGFAKTYAMTGWRLGIVACAETSFLPLLKVHQYLTTSAVTFTQVGLAQSLASPHTERAVQTMLETFGARRNLLVRGLSQFSQLKVYPPQGAFYLLVDVSGTGLDAERFCQRLLQEHYLAMVPLSGFGAHCQNLARISYAASTPDLEEGLERMRTFLERF